VVLKISRQLKYSYLRFISLRGEPHELALGITFGIFAGMMPIIPFQTALAITLALFFKGSKITAVLGTWISNPLNWYFVYYYSYKIGATILGLSEKNRTFASVMESIRHSEQTLVIVGKILGAGGGIISAFLIGGFILATVFALPSYFVFLRVFRFIRKWREKRRGLRPCQKLSLE
jgi:uncharacterized protein (DUF2062 family)